MKSLREFLWSKSDPRKSLYTHMYEAAVAMRVLLTDSIIDVFDPPKKG